MAICCRSPGGFVAAWSCTPPPCCSSSSSCCSSRWTGVVVGIGGRRVPGIRASVVDSQGSTGDFAKRTEQAWLISKQPEPVMCCSCNAKGYVDCKWCRGTGFFIIGDNVLCEVPSRNTSCVICSGKGSTPCTDCKGTGFRAKWLGPAPSSSSRPA